MKSTDLRIRTEIISRQDDEEIADQVSQKCEHAVLPERIALEVGHHKHLNDD